MWGESMPEMNNIQNNEDYNFGQDVINITYKKWKELEAIDDQIEKQKNQQTVNILHEARQSKEYMIEFVFTITEYFGDSNMDPSPYLHTSKYILNHFDIFEEMENTLYDHFGEEAYVTSMNDSGLEKEQFEEMVTLVGEFAAQYVEQYYNAVGSSAKHMPWNVVHQVFHLSLLVMLELENDFVAFFDTRENR